MPTTPPGRRLGEHDWQVIVRFQITAEDAERLVTGKDAPPDAKPGPQPVFADQLPAPDDKRVFLGIHNMVRDEVVVGCFRCEARWTPEIAPTPCPGEPVGYKSDGEPMFDAGNGEVQTHEQFLVACAATGAALMRREVGRNDPCWCGSGKKFKRCHGDPSAA